MASKAKFRVDQIVMVSTGDALSDFPVRLEEKLSKGGWLDVNSAIWKESDLRAVSEDEIRGPEPSRKRRKK